MMLRFSLCFLMVFGASFVPADSAEAGIFGRRRSSRTYYSQPSRVSRGRGYSVRGVSPIPMRVSSARYRYLKTFYPTLVRDSR